MKSKITHMLMNSIYLLVTCLAAGSYVHGAVFIKLGDIKGESTDADHKEWIDVLSYNFSVETEVDASTGMATGRRTYEPIVIRKRVDKATPAIFEALANNTSLETAEIDFVEVAGDGSGLSVYKVYLTNVTSRVIRQYYPTDEGCPTEGEQILMEEIHLNFAEITMEYPRDGITGSDVLHKSSSENGEIPVDFFYQDNVYSLNISGSEAYTTRLFSLNGRRVKDFRSEPGSRAVAFSARHLQVTPGTYLVKIEMNSGETGVWPVTVK